MAAIAIPRLGGFRSQSALAADRATAATIQKAAETYAAGQNMTEAQKITFGGDANNITTLTTAGMLNATDIVPQSNVAAGTTFELTYNQTNHIFVVTLVTTDGGTIQYPENITAP